MRELPGDHPSTTIFATDDPGHGGACHKYKIVCDDISCVWIAFQNGAIHEHGVNGCHNEDLLTIVADRLRAFQAGPFPCFENEKALTAVEEALIWLKQRTMDRQDRGVEGMSVA